MEDLYPKIESEKDRTDPVSTVEERTTKLMNAFYADSVKVCNTPRENALIARNVMNMAIKEAKDRKALIELKRQQDL